MFDPNLPQAGTEIDAVQMRAQLNGLKDLIDAIVTLTAAQVDGVATLLPGEAATVELNVIGNTLHLTFGIPRGDEGVPGQNGSDGQPGSQGPPFAQAVVDSVTTLNPSDPATVNVGFDGTNVHFVFGIPRGYSGANGTPGQPGPPFAQAVVDAVTTLPPGVDATVAVSYDGANVHFSFGIPRGDVGEQGGMGIQGPPGEVTNAALAAAISGTSSNTNAVTTLDTPFADPDTETIRQKLNEVILNGRR
jgi:hypothetical protein